MENHAIDVVIVVSLCLTATAVGLMVAHVKSWRALRRRQLDADEFDYRRRQFRRRMQTSSLLVVLAVALSAGHYLVFWVHSNWFEIGYWGVAMLLTCWLALLAVGDVRATRRHYARQRHRCIEECRTKNDP